MENTLDDKKLKTIQDFKPINDVFFEVLADDVAFCQEILRVILEDDNLIASSVNVQKDVKNLMGRSVRLDVLCTLGDGTICNIEVQRANNDNHFKRIRYNAACITANETEPGTKFENIPSVIMVYISEFDILKGEKTTYHIDKVVRETGEVLDDGMKIVCVNTKINDGSRIAQLMQLFIQKEVNEPNFPAFTNRMNYIKHSERGKKQMCEVMEKYAKEYAQDKIKETKKEMIQEMLKDNMSMDKIAQYANTDINYIVKIQMDMTKNEQ